MAAVINVINFLFPLRPLQRNDIELFRIVMDSRLSWKATDHMTWLLGEVSCFQLMANTIKTHYYERLYGFIINISSLLWLWKEITCHPLLTPHRVFYTATINRYGIALLVDRSTKYLQTLMTPTGAAVFNEPLVILDLGCLENNWPVKSTLCFCPLRKGITGGKKKSKISWILSLVCLRGLLKTPSAVRLDYIAFDVVGRQADCSGEFVVGCFLPR